MELSPCPIEFETEVLVSGSLEISSEKLARGLSWLATSLKEQNKILGSLCGQVDALQETASLPRTEPQERRMSMKDEMLSMQLNALKHEVGALPQPADLERQRERIMAEVQSVSNSLSDRQRDSNQRLQKDLAEATESLCSQLGRIGDSVSARLVVLESHMASRPALAAASNQSRVELPGSGVQAQVLPALDPLSASNVAADDTEDQTDGTFGPDLAAQTTNFGNLRADLNALNSRISTRLEALERQLSELVQKSLAWHADGAGKSQDGAGTSESSADPSHARGSGRLNDSPQPVGEGEVSEKASVAEAVTAAVEAAKEVATAEAVKAATAAISAVTVIAEEAKAAACANSEMMEAKEKDGESIAEAIASLGSQVATLQQSVAALAESPNQGANTAEVTVLGDGKGEKAGSMRTETPEGPIETDKAQTLQPDSAGIVRAETVTASLSDRMTEVEASLAKLTAEFFTYPVVQELQGAVRAVPQLEASISSLQLALAGMAAHETLTTQKALSADHPDETSTLPAAKSVQQGSRHTEAEATQAADTRTAQAGQAAKIPEQSGAVASAKDLSHQEDSSLAKLEERLKHMEDLQEAAERRILRLEGPNEAQRRVSAEKLSDREGWRPSKSEPPSGGTVGGSWKDVQAELEHFRKLFEFIEGVLPRDAAEAMRFFNRRQLGKEVLSEMVSEVFGADVEFQNAKLQLESDFRVYTRELRREFDKLTLALKALQRETEGSEGKLLDLAKRTFNLEMEVRTSKKPPEDTPQVSSGEAGADLKDRAEAGQGSEEMQKAIQDLREEVKHWLETFKSSVIQALQTKPDNEQVVEFIKQVAAAPSGESIALFAKRQLLGKCASCETPIDVDLLRVKRPQPIGLQEPWPPGESLGAKVAIRPLNTPVSPSCSSLSRLPKIQEPRIRELAKKGMKSSPSAPEMRKETSEA